MALIREILLAIENNDTSGKITNYDEDTIKYHQALAIEANLVHGKVLSTISNKAQIPSAVRS